MCLTLSVENRHAHELAVIFRERNKALAIENLDPV
jgi:hypothetical protein